MRIELVMGETESAIACQSLLAAAALLGLSSSTNIQAPPNAVACRSTVQISACCPIRCTIEPRSRCTGKRRGSITSTSICSIGYASFTSFAC